jgi:hypothetical protein
MATSYNSKIVTDGLVLCLDAANPKSYSPNVHPNPTDIYSWVNTSVGNNCTLSRDTIQSPVGTKPLKMVITGSDAYTNTYSALTWNLLPAVAGQTWTVSVWVKASITTTMEGPYIFGANSSGTYLEASSAGSTAFTVTTSWTRISYTYTLVNASTTNLQVRLDGTQTGGSGVTIWWDGLQVERSSSMTTFNSKTNTNGTNWFDQSGNELNGTLVGSPTYSPTNNGNLVFNGTNQYASISYTSILTPTTSITFESFAYLDNWNITGDNRILSKTQGGGYQIGLNEANMQDGFVGCLIFLGSSYKTSKVARTTLSAGWHHLCFTCDGRFIKMYVDGNIVNTYDNGLTETISYSANNILAIAAEPNNTTGIDGAYWTGKISNIKVYNKALTSDQVLQNFNATRGRYGI